MPAVDNETRTDKPGAPVKPGSGSRTVRPLVWVGTLLVTLTVALTGHWSGEPVASEPGLSDNLPPVALLPNFQRVHPYLFRGGAPRQGGLPELKKLGVKTIIDFRMNPVQAVLERAEANSLGMTYVHLPTGNFVPTKALQSRYFQLVEAACAAGTQMPLFVHCAHGSDRTGFMIAMWRVEHDHWSIAEAAAEALSRGFLIHKVLPPEATPAAPD